MRLVTGLLLLALPLAVAVWAFGAYAYKRERNNVDSQLVHTINDGVGTYTRKQHNARKEAMALANRPNLQKAFVQHDRRTLTKIENDHPGVVILSGPKVPPGIAAQAWADVREGKRTVGRVLVNPLDRAFLSAVQPKNGQVGLFVGRRLLAEGQPDHIVAWPVLGKPVDLRAPGVDSRAVGVRVPALGRRAALVALKSRSEMAEAASRARWIVVAVGLSLIAALLILAYTVAPAIARSRLTRQQRDQAERVLAHLGDGVFVVDEDGVVRLWNPAAEAITGLRATGVVNRKAEVAIPGWATIAAFVPVANRPGDSDGASSAETVPVDVDGRELWLSVVAVALGDETVYAFRDATHDRKLEDLRSQFVATISHELRTPLASLHGAAMTLREHDLPTQTQDDLLAMIAEQSNRLANLVEEILVAGQLDSGVLSVVVDTFEPEELVRSVVATASTRIGEKTTIEMAIPPVLPKVLGDGERTRQVLLNLLDNAIKYSPSGGQIEVSLTPIGDQLRFSVSDQGLGIPVGEQERIFDKFYRLDPDQRRGIGGTGLGLYICRALVRSMHGRIWVESEPGRGTTFAFELPAEPLAAAV